MRFTLLNLPGLLLLAGFFMPLARAQPSFGPEVSAEDFGQHVLNLQAIQNPASANASGVDALQSAYLTRQFARLGIARTALACPPGVGFQALLPGTRSDTTPVVYKAHWRDAYEVAGVLEVAERFMTQRPRPGHDIAFVFTDDACTTAPSAARQITPENLARLPAPALVQYLNGLHTQGK